jgi:hypothetical protein
VPRNSNRYRHPKAALPGLPAAEKNDTRRQAKSLVRDLITGARSMH